MGAIRGEVQIMWKGILDVEAMYYGPNTESIQDTESRGAT